MTNLLPGRFCGVVGMIRGRTWSCSVLMVLLVSPVLRTGLCCGGRIVVER